MSLQEVIRRTHTPLTREMLLKELQALGVERGQVLMVHSSLSRLGYVVGGAVTVIEALIEAVGEQGTLVMPAQSTDLSDPAQWNYPPVPSHWWNEMRRHMPAYDPRTTMTYGMGKIAETFRSYPGVLRSSHPHFSFCAYGRLASDLLHPHTLEQGLGESSPLGRCYRHQARILLLGVDHEVNTALHLAEYRANYPGKAWVLRSAPVASDAAGSIWSEWTELEMHTEDFQTIGRAFEEKDQYYQTGPIGMAHARLIEMVPFVDEAVRWMEARRLF
ncbi:aminoglycoside N(3)-acetyltransferase [Marinicrinis sediminis]|uniref:Aminoglycoside N(3)-acetyltransferase n=1 Tax=Marinicrinis sediminis TaxID=1652465 RepID=A0ABW5R9V1_9BACL